MQREEGRQVCNFWVQVCRPIFAGWLPDGAVARSGGVFYLDDVGRPGAFGAFFDDEFYREAWVQVFEAKAPDAGVMDEDVVALFGLDEAVAFLPAEPFDSACCTMCDNSYPFRGWCVGGGVGCSSRKAKCPLWQ